MPLREVLFLAYYFPPLGMGGVQRTLKLVKYIPRWGWRPLVLTVKPIRYYASDVSLLNEVPTEAKVIRSGSLDPFRIRTLFSDNPDHGFTEARSRFKPALDWLAFPDFYLGWLPYAVSSGMATIRAHQVEAIMATAPPYTAHIAGGILAQISALPLILDYRDAWTFESPRSFPTRLHLIINRFLETKTLSSAARVLTVNETIARGLRNAIPPSSGDKVQVLSLGYDPEDFEKAHPIQPLKFRISHVGTLIGERSPKPLLQALQCLIKCHPELRKVIEVRFVGNTRSEDREMIRQAGLEDIVSCIPYLPHEQSVSELLSAHVLYLVIGAQEGETISTGKLYEYLGARKTILASAPSCEAARTIQETKAGSVFHPDDSEGLAQEIFRLYSLHREGKLSGPSFDAVRRYDRRELAHELARHLSEVT